MIKHDASFCFDGRILCFDNEQVDSEIWRSFYLRFAHIIPEWFLKQICQIHGWLRLQGALLYSLPWPENTTRTLKTKTLSAVVWLNVV